MLQLPQIVRERRNLWRALSKNHGAGPTCTASVQTTLPPPECWLQNPNGSFQGLCRATQQTTTAERAAMQGQAKRLATNSSRAFSCVSSLLCMRTFEGWSLRPSQLSGLNYRPCPVVESTSETGVDYKSVPRSAASPSWAKCGLHHG